jgi:hypothetical protein
MVARLGRYSPSHKEPSMNTYILRTVSCPCRVEAERLQLQQRAASLADNKQQLTSDVLRLRQQLAEVHAAFEQSQQQGSQLSALRDRLEEQVHSNSTGRRPTGLLLAGVCQRAHVPVCPHPCFSVSCPVAS